MANDYDYQLRSDIIPGSDWVSVSKEGWIKAERAAGFRPALWSGHPDYMTTCATGGFNDSRGVSGRIVLTPSSETNMTARAEALEEAAKLGEAQVHE